ncbi:MAG: glycosyltransferase [Edaphobacter sp.]
MMMKMSNERAVYGNESERRVAVSVVIPAFNEEADLGGCLVALKEQTLPASQFEVIVVDNGSTDATCAVAEGFSSMLPLRIVRLPRSSISAARNRGAARAVGSELVFVDADCRLKPRCLQDFLARGSEEGIRGCHYALPANSTWVGKVWTQFQARDVTGPASFVPGGGLFVSKKNFDALGGFDEQVKTSEDIDICTRAKRLGLSITSDPSLAVVHEGTPRTLLQFYRQHRWHGRHVLRNFLHKLPSMENAGVVALSAYTFLMFWMTVLLIPALFFHHGWWTGAAFGLLILPPTVLALWVSRGRVRSVGLLFALYGAYALARAASLAHVLRND